VNLLQGLRDLASGLANQVTRAKHVSAVYAPQGGRIFLQLTGFADEVHNNVELLLPYGMSARPVGQTADLLVFQVNASRDHKVAIAGADPALQVPDLAEGEFGFRDGAGQQIVFRSDRVEVTTPKKLVVTTTGDCDLTATGNVNVQGAAIVLAGGGPAVARVGDTVTCPAGTGHITSGSAKVNSG
jgi:phage gp45-like